MKRRLIIDVGSGVHPYPKADILCDLFIGATPHRLGEPAKLDDRPFLVCDVQYLPFKTKSFFFVYCWHVVEHTNNPTKALNELKRIGRHGYIAFPSRIWELFFQRQCKEHQWVVNPSGNHISTQKGYTKVLKRFTRFLWNYNCQIRFRERVLLKKLMRIKNSIITW